MRGLGICVAFAIALSLLVTPEVEAARWGKIYVLKKRPPMRIRSMSSLLRKYSSKHVWPRKNDKKKWQLDFVAFFKQAPRDFEVKVRFFDITESKRFVAGDSIYLSKKGERILVSDMVLEKPKFRVNRRYSMIIINARTKYVLAKTKFWLRGKAETYSGRVVFSDKEAR